MSRRAESKRTAADFLPDLLAYNRLQEAAQYCEGCDLYRDATQTVFGEGAVPARLMLVGEQPGDKEDLQGKPFVGPAGRVLDDALLEANIERNQVFVTNTVKHFKFESRGKRRLHKKPGAREMAACSPWLEAEVQIVQPEVLVCLGATAAQAIIGRDFRITRQRGTVVATSWCDNTIATYHPSAVLRGRDEARRQEVWNDLVADMKKIADLLR